MLYTAKLSLEFKLIGPKRLNIEVLYFPIPKHLIQINPHFYCKINNFTIWSFGEFFFNELEFRLPSNEYQNDDMKYSYLFNTDFERKFFLKKLYKSLLEWSNDPIIFPDDVFKSQILVYNNNWTIH